MVSEDALIQTLKDRGLSCAKLKSMEKRQLKDSAEFRRVGFNSLADIEEKSASKIRELRNKVCKLR